jgi:hypothetical protein
MREQDMRLRIERFMKARMRNMLLPATLGLGLALGGCDSDGLSADDGGDPAAKHDAAANTDLGIVALYMAQMPDVGVAMKYMAQIPDAGPEIPIAAPEYIAPIVKEDAGIAVRYMAQMPDAGGGAVAMYLAQMP